MVESTAGSSVGRFASAPDKLKKNVFLPIKNLIQ
jgi:hypothetical protein